MGVRFRNNLFQTFNRRKNMIVKITPEESLSVEKAFVDKEVKVW